MASADTALAVWGTQESLQVQGGLPCGVQLL